MELGLPGQWKANKSFVPQNIDVPEQNWPTTGADRLRFTLTMANATDSDSLSFTSTSNIPLKITRISTNVANIEIAVNYDLSKAVSTTFTLQLGTIPIYRFKISKWYLDNPSSGKSYAYGHDPSISDYTNATHDSKDETDITPGTFAHWQIGGGLFSEWGGTAYAFNHLSERYTSISQLPRQETSGIGHYDDKSDKFYNISPNGRIMVENNNIPISKRFGVCVTP